MATTYSQPGTSTLPRGRACATCRRRKTKCDGALPVCGQCLRAKKPEDCEYTVGNEPTQNQLLEERIRLLESRIQELTTPARANSNVTLHQPYQPTPESPTTYSATMSPSIDAGSSLEPSKKEASHLLDILMLHASEFAFFLDEERFRESLLLDFPLGHPYRPSSALTMTAYLVGMFLSRDEELSSRQKQTLAAAAQMSAQALSSTHPQRVMHGIQAELMLACYFFAQSRLLEGQYHLATAASTALATGVLKTSKTQNEFSDLLMPPVKDSVEERERINACWTIYYLDYGWAAALNTFPNLKCTPDALRGVNGLSVPGSLEMGKMAVNGSSNHRNGKKPSMHITNGSPVINGHGSSAVNGHGTNGHSSPAMNGYHGSSGTNGFRSSTNGYDASNGTAGSSRHNGVNGNGFGVPAVNGNGAPSYDGDTMGLGQKAEAAFWWRYATDTVQSWRSDMTYDEIASFSGKFSSTIGSIDALLSSIMSAEQAGSSPTVFKHLLLAYSYAYGAQMLLHGVLMHENDISRGKCLTATASIFKLATSIPSHNPGYIDPLIGVLWSSAGKTLIKEASRLRLIRHNALTPTTQDEEQIHNVYNQALQVMTTARSTSPFLRKQVRELTEAYQSHVAGELLA
ncbi:hypothetical protein M378DRAFT_9992 [Amanita muscaria Koide BX008]|uniref:Zn(2)-C6 fungal-type domain-containing protein n=1 Tax=Amanita muscaria (strain Koide BX008) TaxID=946122 RepID=A0A0C2TI37_AMAMK|nr:hypothetical protein M378DRAFT_9992 [Amanita muscaria Koide BX008]